MDTRWNVNATHTSPWRKVCLLTIEFADAPTMVATGWLAAPRVLITAAHCVLDRQSMRTPNKVTAIPGNNGSSTPFGSSEAVGFRWPLSWQHQGDRDADYGAVYLAEPIGTTVGWFGFAALTDSELAALPVKVAGYPNNRSPDGSMWAQDTTLDTIEPKLVQYRASIWHGDSGAPIWTEPGDGSTRQVIGIHTREDRVGYGTAVRIEAEVLENIRQWIADE